MVDLDPGNYAGTIAAAVSGTQQVGFGVISRAGGRTDDHALLWNGTAGSAVDLQPTSLSGFIGSYALGTNGTQQVGYAYNLGVSHAIVWNGTADSAMDLDKLLPSGLGHSSAYTIDSSGNVFGTAYDANGQVHVIEWAATPEPSARCVLASACLILWITKRRRPRRWSLPQNDSDCRILSF
jgi:hypothetical protein